MGTVGDMMDIFYITIGGSVRGVCEGGDVFQLKLLSEDGMKMKIKMKKTFLFHFPFSLCFF